METKYKKCDCHSCKRSRKLTRILASDNLKAIKKAFNIIRNELACVEEEAAYDACILNGTWPSAIEQLMVALEKAKAVKAERDKEEENERLRLINVNWFQTN